MVVGWTIIKLRQAQKENAMARKKQERLDKINESKYNIPDIIMEYAESLMPDLNVLESFELSEEEKLEFFDKAVFFSTSIWNFAALPPDCGAIMLEQMRKSLEETDWYNKIVDIIVEVAQEMRDSYPDAEVIITDHRLELLDDYVEFYLETIPLDEGIRVIRAAK